MSVILKGGTTGLLADVNSRKALLSAAEDVTTPSYLASVSGQANTTSSDVIAIESGPTLVTRIRRIVILQPGTQTTAGLRLIQLVRTTTAGVAGTIVPPVMDPQAGDAPFSGTVRAKPTTQGAGGVVLLTIPVFVPAALAAFAPLIVDMDAVGLAKSVTIPVGTANGVALRDPGAAGGANLAAFVVFTEETS